jgi:UDP-2,3-diacylglucosamine pyrophosphatase LpxH
MDHLSWSRGTSKRRIERIPGDGVVYVISDIHLGDGSTSDIFVAKDRQLMAFLDQVEDEDATLVIAGDAIDFSQAWFFTEVLRAHGKVLGRFSDLAGRGKLFYVLGNHDHDLRLYVDVLRIPVVHGVEIGDKTLVLHGYEFDPVIGVDIEGAEYRTKVHHLVERVLGTWLRLPLQHFYNGWNRCSFWLFHKLVWARRRTAAALDAVTGGNRRTRHVTDTVDYWTRCQLGDPASIFHPACHFLDTGPYETLICGHSHLPGQVHLDSGKRYANTGSWTFTSSAVLRMEGAELEVRDWIRDHAYGDEYYRPLIEGRYDQMTFEDWWRDNYMGWLRYRVGEEELHGKLPPAPEVP